MGIYNSYLKGPARKMAIFDADMSNQIDKVATMYEMVSLKSDQVYRNIETKIYLEGGDIDDMTYLYQEAEEASVEKKKSVIAKIFDWFKKIFAAAAEKISGILRKDGDNDDIEVPSNTISVVEALKKHFNAIKMALIKIKNGNFLGGLKDLGKAALPELALIATTTAIVKRKKIKELIGVVKDIMFKSKDTTSGAEKAVAKIDGEDGLNDAQTSLTLLQRIMNGINGLLTALVNLASKAPVIGKFFKKKDNKEEENVLDEDDELDYLKKLREDSMLESFNEDDDYIDTDYSFYF